MRLETLADAKKIGYGWWVTLCCHLDLYQLRSVDELVDVYTSAQDFEEDQAEPVFQAWPTLRDALEAISSRGMVDMTSGGCVPFTHEKFYQEFRDHNSMWQHKDTKEEDTEIHLGFRPDIIFFYK